ncbi:hypothetical protein AgCh_001004 [Apium graveolens]
MGVYTFVCRSSGGEWTGKQHKEGDLEASTASTYELMRKLVQAFLFTDSSGGVQSSFSFVCPNSTIFQILTNRKYQDLLKSGLTGSQNIISGLKVISELKYERTNS